MSLFGQTKRHIPASSARRSPLPVFAHDSEKKYGLSSPSTSSSYRFFTAIYVPLPRLPFLGQSSSSSSLLNGDHASSPLGKPYHKHARSYSQSHRAQRYVKIWLPIPQRVYNRLPRLNTPMRVLLGALLVIGFVLFLLGFRKRGPGNTWTPPFSDPSTLVLTPDELAMIWEWEVLSGHHPSLHPPPEALPLSDTLHNPAVPGSLLPSLTAASPLVAYHQRTTNAPRTQLIGVGPERNFVNVWDSIDHQPGFPARPTPGTIIDLDLILEKCDLDTNKYVRDCLEFLRIGGGLDNGRRVRRGNYLGSFKQLYYEESAAPRQLDWSPRAPSARGSGLSRTPLKLSSPFPVASSYDSKSPCDPQHPRVFHMFWAGPFNDKPYMAVMSFLFTQNLGLDQPIGESSEVVGNTCRTQFWVWINPGPAAAVPNPNAKREMFQQLATNPWSAPFLHERFKDVVKFRMWNTTEQLDGVDELKDHWRQMPIFNSGGNTYKPAAPQQTAPSKVSTDDDDAKLGEVLASEGQAEKRENEEEGNDGTFTTDIVEQAQPVVKKKKDELFEKVGSSSESDYDRLSVILSDMARFVLTYRFGGIYLDADTIFLRDWEELWNYRGQFAYRWSKHPKYNTAVLKLHKGSALGKFLFKTSLENGLDFHPMTVSRYLKDANLERLLFRIPDALFDPAWLNMERLQRERPPFPYFPEFSQFFSNDKFDTAAPQPLGFDGFFRGAFSYHFHNFWWLPFDPSRNWPDLGTRFIKGENTLREALKAAKAVKDAEDGVNGATDSRWDGEGADLNSGVTGRDDMDDEVDLSWSTVLKRSFEAYLRGERPNAYGEWIDWESRQ